MISKLRENEASDRCFYNRFRSETNWLKWPYAELISNSASYSENHGFDPEIEDFSE